MGAAGVSVTAAVRDARRGRPLRMEDPRTGELLDELAGHMRDAGELTDAGEVRADDAGLEEGLVLEQKAKLVLLAGADAAYVVPSGQDWAHDALGDAAICPGMLFSDGEPFSEGDACVTGYFQADADGRWARVESGRAAAGASGIEWRDGLEAFPEVVAQLEECMHVSAYRHVAEQAALKDLAGA
ncbi:hypothetical protein [uncultured Senegalimassilia sp.]|uniref:hypothetical protein n=1 Tax=uncultured Senegalimassilia sp. TaxID=1714350 RepID=UPI0025EE3831|nr:hypothetical protein [uncultured Senegalimassilia sp.]